MTMEHARHDGMALEGTGLLGFRLGTQEEHVTLQSSNYAFYRLEKDLVVKDLGSLLNGAGSLNEMI